MTTISAPTTFPIHPHSPLNFAAIKATVAEPFLVVAVSLFWLLTLPIAALLAAAVALGDKVKELKLREIRLVWSYQFGLRAETRPLRS